jgi:hypothetical protein
MKIMKQRKLKITQIILTACLSSIITLTAVILISDPSSNWIQAASPTELGSSYTGLRRFYLTTGTYLGSQAASACDTGFHMASLWEMVDPSNLEYETSRGFTQADSGSGPPLAEFGWMRTGYAGSAGALSPGQPNCNAWTSQAVDEYGTLANLETDFNGVSYGWNWYSTPGGCWQQDRVWCIEDSMPWPRPYYLTQSYYDGSQASTACEDGYHMASIWEIMDTTNLQYESNLGITRDDSGQGPPSYYVGWVRTGYQSYSGPVIGGTNCYAWSNNTTEHNGTAAYLPNDWTEKIKLAPWWADSYTCNSTLPVWCVGDQAGERLYLPLVQN